MKSKLLNKIGFAFKKHSPEIFLVAGVVGTITSTVLACRATTKISKIMDEHKETIDKIDEYPVDKEYTEEDKQSDKHIVKVQTAVKLVKLYAPAVGLGVISLSSIIMGHKILRKRNLALAAAYAAVDQGFKEYRQRVVEKFGKEVDYKLLHNIKEEEIEETIIDEKGKEKKVKKTIEVADPDNDSPYVKYFTRTNPNWEGNDTDYVETWLRMQQSYANDKLRALGHLTLNQVYDMLGFKDTKAGMVVGWIYNPDNPTGDNYVEFDVHKVMLTNEAGEYEEALSIDFNVDGNIYTRMA